MFLFCNLNSFVEYLDTFFKFYITNKEVNFKSQN